MSHHKRQMPTQLLQLKPMKKPRYGSPPVLGKRKHRDDINNTNTATTTAQQVIIDQQMLIHTLLAEKAKLQRKLDEAYRYIQQHIEPPTWHCSYIS